MSILWSQQVVSVYFTLRAQLTKGSLAFSTRAIDFGDLCYITEVCAHSLDKWNRCHRPFDCYHCFFSLTSIATPSSPNRCIDVAPLYDMNDSIHRLTRHR